MNNIVNTLMDAKLTVIPIKHKSKAPLYAGWQTRTPDQNNIDEFSGPTNVGVVLGTSSGNIVDIDLDNLVAVQLAPHFLPKTGWVFGRKSKPKSHWIYRVTDPPGASQRFTCEMLGTICEFRANGGQTVFPPSVHETGEQIEFAEFTDMTTTRRDTLITACKRIGGATQLASIYRKGIRQDLILALSGTLLAANKPKDDILRLVKALCEVTNDEETATRIEAVELTAKKKAAGEPFTQWRHLKELVGDDIADGLSKHFGLSPRASADMSAAALCSHENRNDTGIAHLFSQHVRGKVIYVPENSAFYVYSYGIWERDMKASLTSRQFDHFILAQVKQIRSNAQLSPERCSEDLKFLLKYRNRQNAENAIKQSRAFLQVPLEKLDACDDMLAVQNGLLDLKRGTLHPFEPQHYITKRSSVIFDAKAQCPLFTRFLNETFGNDESLITYLKAIMGYWLTGRTDRQEFYIFYGEGGNGKSTLLNIINHILGPFCGAMMAETLFESRNGQQNGYDLASLTGARLAIAQEAQSKFTLNSPLVKQVSGKDCIKVRMLYCEPFIMTPKFKLVLVCNRRPMLDAYDEALKRRLRLVPFNYIVPKEKRDRHLEEKLISEAPGILNFLIEGTKAYLSGSISEPYSVTRATETYFYDQDSIQSFLDERSVKKIDACVGKRILYEQYTDYCKQELLDPVSMKEFGRILVKIGFESTRIGSERRWKGLELVLDLNVWPD